MVYNLCNILLNECKSNDNRKCFLHKYSLCTSKLNINNKIFYEINYYNFLLGKYLNLSFKGLNKLLISLKI